MAFLSDITLGAYFPGSSFIHRLDPRTKFIAMLILLTGVVSSLDFIHLFAYLLLFIAAVLGSRLPFGLLLRNLKPFLWLFVLTVVFHLFFTSGESAFRVPGVGLSVSGRGAVTGAVYSIRLALLILYAALFTLTTSPIEMTDALEKLLAPLRRIRLPVHEIVMMLTLSLRFVPTLIEEAQRLMNAQRSRGASFTGGPLRRARSVVPLIVPLFVSAFRRADDLALAMDARCYSGGQGRTAYKRLSYNRSDICLLCFCVAVLIPSLFA